MEATLESVNEQMFDNITVSTDEDFVGIAVSLHKGKASHCGIVVCYNKELHLFHFVITDTIEMEKLTSTGQKYYLHKLSIIKKDDILTFLAKCEMIYEKRKNDFELGYAFDGSFFDAQNNIVFTLPNQQYTNCVFFCISVIKGFLIGGIYFQHQDWTPDTIATNWYHLDFLRKRRHQLTTQQLEEFYNIITRIPPNEYFSSAKISELPIRKFAVDRFSGLVDEILSRRFGQN